MLLCTMYALEICIQSVNIKNFAFNFAYLTGAFLTVVIANGSVRMVTYKRDPIMSFICADAYLLHF